jgi:glycerophosphoryl diester phosphodiesterase
MKIIGHRGARGLAPENTLASLRKGLEHHADMLEFDVRVTKDSVPILHHDSKMTGANGKKFKICDYSYENLRARFPDITKLSEALDAIDAKAVPYIEVKQKEPVRPIAKVLQQYIGGMYSASGLRLASKSQQTLRELHHALPAVPLIIIERWSGVRAHRRAKELGSTEIAMNQLWLWWGFIRGFKNSEYKLYAYTLNNPTKAERWTRWGLAGAITDYPDRFEK